MVRNERINRNIWVNKSALAEKKGNTRLICLPFTKMHSAFSDKNWFIWHETWRLDWMESEMWMNDINTRSSYTKWTKCDIGKYCESWKERKRAHKIRLALVLAHSRRPVHKFELNSKFEFPHSRHGVVILIRLYVLIYQQILLVGKRHEIHYRCQWKCIRCHIHTLNRCHYRHIDACLLVLFCLHRRKLISNHLKIIVLWLYSIDILVCVCLCARTMPHRPAWWPFDFRLGDAHFA